MAASGLYIESVAVPPPSPGHMQTTMLPGSDAAHVLHINAADTASGVHVCVGEEHRTLLWSTSAAVRPRML